MTQVGDLLQLQTLDDEAAGLRSSVSALEARLAGNAELLEARDQLAALGDQLALAQREQRHLEDQAQDLTAKIEPEERRLYGGSVRNPKELASIQHEVDLLKSRRTDLEDQLLSMLDRIEGLTAEQARAAAVFAERDRRWADESAALRAELKRVNDALIRAEARREGHRPLVPARSLAMYDDLRRRKGAAVARVQGGTCGGCRVLLPDAVRRRAAMSPDPVQCPNCERILSAG